MDLALKSIKMYHILSALTNVIMSPLRKANKMILPLRHQETQRAYY